MKPLDLRPPTVESPYEASDLAKEAGWQPYPLSGTRPLFPFLVNEQRFKLYVIAAGLLPVLLSGSAIDSPLPGQQILDSSAKLDRLNNIENILTEWRQQQPPEVRLELDEETPQAVEAVVDIKSAVITAVCP